MDAGNRRVDSRFLAGDANDSMVIDQIMHRFRPIAPKPVTAPSSGQSLPSNDGMLTKKRVKRKYVRVKKKKSLTINDSKGWLDLDRTVTMIENCNENEFVVTDPVQKVSNWISFSKQNISNSNTPVPLELSSSDLHAGTDPDPALAEQRGKVVESWITMESVTGTCEDRKLLGYTDEEIWKNLEKDSCPGFISNSYNKVYWVNLAYRRMVDLNPEDEAPTTDVVVLLGIKVEKSTVVKFLPAFSCIVRIVYRSLSEKKTQMTVPCDVWKMDSGGFAWRLDVESALSLGPLN